MDQSKKIQIAVDLIDFCGRDLTASKAFEFFTVRKYNLTDGQERSVMLLALAMLRDDS